MSEIPQTNPVEGIIVVRQSRLKRYDACGEEFRRGEIEGEYAGPGTAAIRGIAFHEAAAENHRQKIETGRDLPKTNLIEITDTEFAAKEQAEDVHFTEDELRIGKRPALLRARAEARAATEVYSDRVADQIQPKLVEEDMKSRITGTKVILKGRIDVVTQDHWIDDLKTTTNGRRWTQKAADEDHQFTVYGILLRAETGQWPRGYRLRVINADTRTEKTITTRRTRRDIEVFVARMNQMLESMRKGVYKPAEPGHWKCSPKWCSFTRTCSYFNAERSALARL